MRYFSLLFIVAIGCGPRPTVTPADGETPLAPTPGVPWFVDTTEASNIDFKLHDKYTDEHHIIEIMGSGIAWIDYDADGWLDLLCIQHGAFLPDLKSPKPTHKFYRNHGDGTFRDVTEAVGLDRAVYGMGCDVGDFDNDGFDDLVITHFGGQTLFHNEADAQGGRKFVDVTKVAGMGDNPHWATSCAWADVDGDGWLDLYVCNYCEIDPKNYMPCYDKKTGEKQTCPPTVFPATAHKLYRNLKNGKFEDASVSSGISKADPAPGLAVAATDFDLDGAIDFYIANDWKPAHLLHNDGKGHFTESALLTGCGLQSNGRYMAGMGVGIADVDQSGRPSMLITNFYNEPNVLFLNKGKLLFQEWSHPSGLGAPSMPRLAFGVVFFDANLDGFQDVAVANGHVYQNSVSFHNAPFEQEAQIFIGEGNAKFRDASSRAGSYFRRKLVGRGVIQGDYDNDGKADLAYSHNAGPFVLLHNETPTDSHWLRLELIGNGTTSNRNAIGARIEVEVAGVTQTHFVIGGGSYLSASERRTLAGLGKADKADKVTIHWPDGTKHTFTGVAGNAGYRIEQKGGSITKSR